METTSEILELWPFAIKRKVMTIHWVEKFYDRKLLTIRLKFHLWIRYLFTYLRLGFGWTIWSVEKISMWDLDHHDPKKKLCLMELVQHQLLFLHYGRSYSASNGLLLIYCFEIRMEFELGISLICFFQKL
jgi:hypothetical protein